MKRRKISERDQQVVAEILTQFMFTKDMDDVLKTWNEIYERYDLRDDPFTHTPVSPGEYEKNSLEYQKQVMIEKYGHCDGLE